MKISFLIAALIIGATAGYLVGKKNSSTPETNTVTDVRTARRTTSSTPSSGGSSPRGARMKSAAQAIALPGQNARLKALMDYYAGLNPSQFEEEAKKLDDLPWSERIMIGYLLFSRWGEEDPAAAMAYTKTMGMSGMFVKGTVMQSWASKYPEDAARYFTDNPGEFRGGGWMRGRGGSTAAIIATEWARLDSARAMTWAENLRGRDQRDALRGVFSEVAKKDPAEAVIMLASISDPQAQKNAQNTIAREWGSKDWDAAKSWIAGLPADQQTEATARAIRGLADEDPQTAAAKISSIPEGKEQSETMESIARKWSLEDPAAAAAWVLANGNENAQEQSIGRVVSTWVGQDAAAALKFVNEQPEGAVRDRAVSSYVRSNRSGDAQDNIELAETIGDERSRARAITITARAWLAQDKEAATEYIETSESLSPESKARIKSWTEGRGRSRR